MATFEIEANGKTYEIEAPTVEAATAALGGARQSPAQEPAAPTNLKGAFLSDDPRDWQLPQNKAPAPPNPEAAASGSPSVLNMINDVFRASERAKAGPQNVSPQDVLALGSVGPGAPALPRPVALETALNAGKAVAAPVRNAVRGAVNPEGEAARRVAESYRSTMAGEGANIPPENLQHMAASQLQERMAAPGGDASFGGETRLMDIMGERGRALARSAANTSPEARDTLQSVIQPRFEAQAPRLEEFLRDVSGGPTAGESRAALEEMARTARKPFYDAAFRAGANGINSPALDELTQSPAVQEAVRDATKTFANRRTAGRTVTDPYGTEGPTLEFWDIVKRNLNDSHGALSRAGRNAEAGDVAGITDRLVSALDEAVPSYAQARGVAHGIFRANDALEAGANYVTSRVGAQEAEKAIAQMTKQERQLFRQGYTERLIEHANEVGDRRNLASTIAGSPAARERMEVALGPMRAQQVETFLHHERLMDLARGAVSGNSTTARQLMELGLAGGVGSLVGGFSLTNPAGWIAAVITKYGANKAGAAIDTRVANHVAQLLASRDPSVMRRGIKLAASNPNILSALRRADEKLSSIGRPVAIEQENGAPPKRPQTFEQALKLPKGTRFVDPHGVERVR
jgi:hypothetical protein